MFIDGIKCIQVFAVYAYDCDYDYDCGAVYIFPKKTFVIVSVDNV